MKRILIVNNNMHIGGVQKALVNLLNEICSDFDVTLLLFYPGGELLRQIPEQVRVISAAPAFRTLGMNRTDSRAHHLTAVRAFYALITRLAGIQWALKLQLPFQETLGPFDAAVSFLHSGPPHAYYGGCNAFVLRCVDAKRKIAFLHCDYGKICGGCPDHAAIYSRFDRIAACSEGCRDAFLAGLAQLREKTVVVHNCQNYEAIRALAKMAPVPGWPGRLNVVITARFGREKGIPRAVRAIAMLGQDRARLHCRIIGGGVEFAKVQALAAQLQLQDTVTLLGELENPYGYMAAADLLLIPSYSEAAPMVIGEAACLGTPILSTRTSSACEMIEQTGFGWVCDNSCEGIAEGLHRLLNAPEELAHCRQHLRSCRFSNAAAVREFREAIQ